MSDFLVLIVILAFMYWGLTRPYVSFAGYVWVDTFVPQKLVFGFLGNQPISMTMALLCLSSLIFGANKLKLARDATPVFLLISFAIWITVTTEFALVQYVAWDKWSETLKTLMMAFFLIFAINNRKQLEMVLLIILFSLSFFMVSAGLKTLTGGGGYGRTLIIGLGNSGLGEGSTLAGFAVLTIPLIIFFKSHITFIPYLINKNLVWYGAILLCVATVIGTSARTGLITLFAYLSLALFNKKYFFKGVLSLLTFMVFFILFAPSSWLDRMNTLQSLEGESSAMSRVAVWLWTLDLAAQRPFLGGGFESYMAGDGNLAQYVEGLKFGMKAPHSIYFEVLGEHGYVGLALYLGLIFWTFMRNRAIAKHRDSGEWSMNLASEMNRMIIVFCVGGVFIGIAYMPLFFHLVALTAVHSKILKMQK